MIGPATPVLVLDPVAGRHGGYRAALGDLVEELVIVSSPDEARRLLSKRMYAGLVVNIDGEANPLPSSFALDVIDGCEAAVFVIGRDASVASEIGATIPQRFDFLPSGIAQQLLRAKIAGLIEQHQVRNALCGSRQAASDLLRDVEVLTSAREEDLRSVEDLKMLVGEQVHRSKNLLAIIQSIALRTMSDGRSMASAREALLGRLRALSRAYQLLTAAGGKGTEIADILEAEAGDLFPKVAASGPSARVAASFVQTFALTVHELFQNAVQHGALAAPDGGVKVGWSLFEAGDDRFLEFMWTESGGQPVNAPPRYGFGLSLVSSLAGNSATAINFAPDGLECRLRLSQNLLVGA
jgi:two-component sensor histidine kinase